MNILVVTKHLDEYAGSELFTRDLCLGLLRAGHGVAAYAWEPGAVSAEMAEEDWIKDGVLDCCGESLSRDGA